MQILAQIQIFGKIMGDFNSIRKSTFLSYREIAIVLGSQISYIDYVTVFLTPYPPLRIS